MHAVARAWFPGNAALEQASGEDFRLRLGVALMRHPLARALVRAGAQRLLPEALAGEIGAPEPLLRSLLTLVSWSKRRVGNKTMPLLSVQVQLWVREARRLLREVGGEAVAALSLVR